MFKRSEDMLIDMFNNILGQLSGRKLKLLEDPTERHNVFQKEIIGQIDESPYAVLYADRKGRPNASVRILIGMMIIKEGQSWSDEQLFEECRFN